MTRHSTGTIRQRRPNVWEVRVCVGADPVSGQPSAEFSLTPTFTLVNGPKGSHYENAGQVTAVNYRPLVPRVSLPASRASRRRSCRRPRSPAMRSPW